MLNIIYIFYTQFIYSNIYVAQDFMLLSLVLITDVIVLMTDIISDKYVYAFNELFIKYTTQIIICIVQS